MQITVAQCAPAFATSHAVKLWHLFTAFSVCFTAVGRAAELTEEDFFDQLPVVISATRLPQTVMDTPASVTVLDRQAIDASGFTSIGDLFRLVPGFQVALGWRDHHTAVTYHGQSDGLSRRMQLLIDGRVALTSVFGLSDWERLGVTIQDIERIEVVRGPVGSAFGSHAFIAAINIVTRDATSTEGWSLSITAGTDETYSASSRYSEVGGDYEYTLGVSYLDSDGFDGSNNEIEVTNLRLYGRNQISDDWAVDYQLSDSQGPSGRGGAVPIVDPVGEKTVREDYGLVRFTNNSRLDHVWYLQLAYHRSHESDVNYVGTLGEILDTNQMSSINGYPLASPQLDQLPLTAEDPVYISTYDLHSDRIMLDGQQILILNPDQRIVWGGGVQESRNKRHYQGRDSRYKTAFMASVHANWEVRSGDFLYNTGFMFEDGDLAAGDVSFRVGMNYELTPNHMLRISSAQGFRTPFVGEAHQRLALETEDGFPIETLIAVPENLEPEKISSVELGYVGNFFKGALGVDAKLFRETLSHEIQEVLNLTVPEIISLFTPGEIQRVNGGETEIEGFELRVEYRTESDFRALLAYSYADADQDLPMYPEPVYPMREHNGTPEHSGSLLLSQQFENDWSASLGFYHLGEMSWLVWGDNLDSYNRVDVRIAKQFQIGDSDGKIELIGQNLGDSYYEFKLKNEFDTQAVIRLTIDL